MALNIDWRTPTVRDMNVNTVMESNRQNLGQAAQGIGTFIKNYRKYKADQEMKGIVNDFNAAKGERESRMQQILQQIKQLEADNQKLRAEYNQPQGDMEMAWNFRR